MPEPILHIALVWPEIPQNTGNVGRLCLGIGARLHLVHPLGFQVDEKAVRRAGLDYWKHVDVVEHADLDSFDAWRADRRTWYFSAHGQGPYTAVPFEEGDVLVFGRESVGLPEELRARGVWSIPMTGPIRSLNVANAVSVVAYGALQRLRPSLFA
jgi:tRNA (cytidine/uridine-2'-O-)-methyltransferase